MNFTALIFRALLWVSPALGAFAGPLSIILGLFLSAEAQLAWNVISDLVHEAEDPLVHPEFAGGGKGWEKFNWVFENAAAQFLSKQIEMARHVISLFIEMSVADMKK